MARMYSTGLAPSVSISVKQLPWWIRYLPSRILFMDDFEGVLKWTQVSGTVTKDSSIDVFEGSNALKMVSGAGAGNSGNASIKLGVVPKTKMALQLRWHANNAAETTLRDFIVELEYFDGAYLNYAAVLYLKNQTTPQNKWQYINPAGSVADIPDASQTLWTSGVVHNYLRLLWNFGTPLPQLLELESNNLLVKPANIVGRVAADATPPCLLVSLAFVTDVALASTGFVDALCLSDQEP